jgi:hypothetical protein
MIGGRGKEIQQRKTRNARKKKERKTTSQAGNNINLFNENFNLIKSTKGQRVVHLINF